MRGSWKVYRYWVTLDKTLVNRGRLWGEALRKIWIYKFTHPIRTCQAATHVTLFFKRIGVLIDHKMWTTSKARKKWEKNKYAILLYCVPIAKEEAHPQ